MDTDFSLLNGHILCLQRFQIRGSGETVRFDLSSLQGFTALHLLARRDDLVAVSVEWRSPGVGTVGYALALADLTTGQLSPFMTLPARPVRLRFSPDGQQLRLSYKGPTRSMDLISSTLREELISLRALSGGATGGV